MNVSTRGHVAAAAVAVFAGLLAGLPAAHGASDDGAAAQLYGGMPIDVLTYHYQDDRTGWNRRETDLTVASVGSKKFGLRKTLSVDGDVLAQPLLVAGFRMPDGNLHDVLLVVTENNEVDAFDANSYDRLWHVNLGTPQNANDVSCGHVHPYYGISATPVIVRKATDRATVYLVSATEPKPHEFHTRLHAIDLADGSAARKPVEIAASTRLKDGSTLEYSAAYQWFRAGLAYRDGGLYLAASSHCDINADRIAGWVMRYDEDLVQTGAFSTIQSPAGYELAAIWAAGYAPAIDTDGSIFAVTGNGNFSKGGRDWGETVLRLTPSLGRMDDFFTPASYQTLNQGDTDFGAGGVMLIPPRKGQAAPPLAVAMGKDHVLYLLDRTRLGHMHPDDTGALQAQHLSGVGVWGGPCYWLGPDGGRVYYQSHFDVLRAYDVHVGAHPSLTESAQGVVQGGFGGSLPIGSSNEGKGGTGVVWTVNRAAPQRLEAYDAQALGAAIFSASIPSWTAGNAFLTPLQANGRVFVGSSSAVAIFGLAP